GDADPVQGGQRAIGGTGHVPSDPIPRADGAAAARRRLPGGRGPVRLGTGHVLREGRLGTGRPLGGAGGAGAGVGGGGVVLAVLAERGGLTRQRPHRVPVRDLPTLRIWWRQDRTRRGDL